MNREDDKGAGDVSLGEPGAAGQTARGRATGTPEITEKEQIGAKD